MGSASLGALLKLPANWLSSGCCVVRSFPATIARLKQFALMPKQEGNFIPHPPLKFTTLAHSCRFIPSSINSTLAVTTFKVHKLYMPKLKVRPKIHKTKVAFSFLNVFYLCNAFCLIPGLFLKGESKRREMQHDGVLLCQKCTFTCNALTSILGASPCFIAYHNDALPSTLVKAFQPCNCVGV